MLWLNHQCILKSSPLVARRQQRMVIPIVILNSINAASIDQLRIIRVARSQFHHHVNYDDVCLLETLEPSSIFIAAASIEPWCLKQSWQQIGAATRALQRAPRTVITICVLGCAAPHISIPSRTLCGAIHREAQRLACHSKANPQIASTK